MTSNKALQFIPAFYASGNEFRGVLRIRKNGKMAGTIPCATLQPSAEGARADARAAALRAILNVPGAVSVASVS